MLDTVRALRLPREHVALVTGARVGAGFEAALMLLRAGATVVGTTRFIYGALERFMACGDYDQWGDRLALFPLDLRDPSCVDELMAYVGAEHSRIDTFLHCAVMRVHHPAEYYQPLIAQEWERARAWSERIVLGAAQPRARFSAPPS